MIRTLLFAAAMAGTIGAATAPAMARLAGPMSTSSFTKASAQSDKFEIREGRMAQRAGGPAARRFGARMVRDHTKTTATLMGAVRHSGMQPPPPPPLRFDQKRMIAQLRGLSGARFDRAYAAQQVRSHKEALALEERYARSGGVPAIRAAAQSAVPIVKMHLRMAEHMAAG